MYPTIGNEHEIIVGALIGREQKSRTQEVVLWKDSSARLTRGVGMLR